MSDSKSGSKSDLNESNMPLLEGEQTEKSGETPEKEQIELDEKDDSSTEKKGKKAKKEKKKKEPKEKKPKGPSKIDVLSEGLNLANRDENDINHEIDLGFDDVLAEPANTQGFDAIWKLSFVLFSQTKLWLYRLISAVVAIPASIFWGIVFSFVTAFYVWIVAPALRLFDFKVFVFRRVWNGLIHATVEPICAGLGAVFSKMNVNQRRNIVQEA